MTANKTLSGRVALVTGAAKRIGRVVALRLADEGADVVIHYHKSEAEAQEAVEEVKRRGRRAAAISADLGRTEDIRQLVAQSVSALGRLDILVNSAANFIETKFAETSEATWDASLDTNLKAPFFCSQAAAPHLAETGNGVIVNFADIGGLLGWGEFLPHSISKSGVMLMTRVLARVLAPKIRVNAIAPGTISMAGDPTEWEKDYIRRTPLQRTGRPEEVADAVLFLITSEFLTGQTLVLDGGRTL
ncbi:MAG TPA: SDR family oxidoreductase [Candidatus Acidoferrum sp.]